MSVVTKTRTSSFNLGQLVSSKLNGIETTDHSVDTNYEEIDYSEFIEENPFLSSIGSIFEVNANETGSTVAPVADIPEIIKSFLESAGISEEYYDIIADLLERLGYVGRIDGWGGAFLDIIGLNEEASLLPILTADPEVVAQWAIDHSEQVAKLLNEYINTNVEGIEVYFTEDFIKEHATSLIPVLINIYKKGLIDKLQSDDIRRVGHALYDLFTMIDDLNISYDEILEVFPGLADYLAGLINLDGLVINDQTLRALWDSITYYRDKIDNGEFSIWDLEFYDKNTTTADIVRALRDIWPSLFDTFDLLGGEQLTDYILKTIIRQMPDIIDDFMDLVDSFSRDGTFKIIGNILSFIDKYDIDIWEIVGGVGGQVFSPVIGPVTSAYDYVVSGQILDDAKDLAEDVGSAIAETAVSAYDYFASGEVLEDVGSAIDEVGSWGVWFWNW